MIPVIDRVPLIDHASGVRNVERTEEHRRRMERVDRDLNMWFFLWGFLAGTLFVTGLALYLGW